MLVTAIQQLPFRGVGFMRKTDQVTETLQAAGAYTQPYPLDHGELETHRFSSPMNSYKYLLHLLKVKINTLKRVIIPKYLIGCADRICTCDLLVMSQMSYYFSTARQILESD